MFFLQKIIYDLFIRATVLGAWVGRFFSKKAKNWLDSRKNWRKNLQKRGQKTAPTLWMHCASLGEFEQGRPVLEAFRKKFPEWKIALTFFSNSGFEPRKNWPGADLIAVLPADTPANARDFQALLQPDLAIFVKYEFWANHLFALKKRGTPAILISADFRKNQPFFHPFGGFWRRMLSCFDHVFVQNQTSADLLRSVGFEKTTVAGDTRIDRVLNIAEEAKRLPIVDFFLENKPALICGSTWEADEKVLSPILQQLDNQWFKCIVAPHELSEATFLRLEKTFPQPVARYSSGQIAGANTLIIDNIGLLSAIYFYGKIAFIGGGFGAGIHNTLEPAAFGLPVIFGPRFEKFEEARQLVESGGFFSVKNESELQSVLKKLENSDFYQKTSEIVVDFLSKNRGATGVILDFLEKMNHRRSQSKP